LKQQISSQVAILIILIFGSAVAWFTISAGTKIINNFAVVENLGNVKKNYELPEEKVPVSVPISVPVKSLKK